MAGGSTIKCSWNEVKKQVQQVNPHIFDVIENDKNLIPQALHILNYSYGQQVGDESFFYFPDNTKSINMPFCMVLTNNFEMYMEFNGNISPWKIYKPGQVFPYTKFLRNNFLYEPSDVLKMTAGTRNSFMLLNKFSDKKNHHILKKHFKLSCNPPKSFEEQFIVFKEICQAAKPGWSASLLAFPKLWEEQANQSPAFANYLNSIANNDHTFKRNTLLYDYLLNTIMLKHQVTTNSFVKEVIKYLLYVACGGQPAYTSSLCEKNAPINFLSDIYVNIYRSDSIPIFMVPHKLIPFTSDETVFYSLNKDDFLFKPNQISNLNKLSQEIKSAFDQTCIALHDSKIAQNTLLYQCTSKVDLDIIHRWNSLEHNNLDKISLFKNQNSQFKLDNSLNLPINSQFLSGCFSLRYKKIKKNLLQENIE